MGKKEYCGVCGKLSSVRKDGRLRKHGYFDLEVCFGSGRTRDETVRVDEIETDTGRAARLYDEVIWTDGDGFAVRGSVRDMWTVDRNTNHPTYHSAVIALSSGVLVEVPAGSFHVYTGVSC